MSKQQQTTDSAGKALAAVLADRAEQLEPAVEQRLATARAAALQAVADARAQQLAPELALAAGGRAPRQGGRARLWAWALPAALLVAGLLGLQQSQWLQQTLGLADRDAAVLKDDLPPDAYRDPAFREYLEEKTEDETTPRPDEEEAKQ
jgi:hypothetical protein